MCDGRSVVLLLSLLLAWHPRRGRELVGELRPWRDYSAMAEIEAHDMDKMLDATDAYRRRRGGRSVGEELADELMRSTWDER
jgi:hypothetical protein